MKKLVIISGGIGVMGQAFSKVLTEDGYDVLLLDIREPSAGEITGEFFKCDISSEEEVAKLSDYLVSSEAEVHGLINNASCQPEGFTNELEDYPADTYRKVLEVNLVGSFFLTKTVIPIMQKNNSGSIVNIGSIQGVVAPTFDIYKGMNITSPLVYSVAKAGIIHFCKWVAAKYGPWNIRCNAVSPGGLGDSQKGGSEFEKVYSSRTPLGRMVRSGEVAEVIRFLISDKSKYITGQNIVIDGGWTIY
jgi:NAD(P)-dependent dehydrogenase (short-subunit alcohol dehydrogenase family)